MTHGKRVSYPPVNVAENSPFPSKTIGFHGSSTCFSMFTVYSTPGILNLSRGFRASQGGQSQLCGQQARLPTKVEATSAMKEGSQHLPTMVSPGSTPVQDFLVPFQIIRLSVKFLETLWMCTLAVYKATFDTACK